MVLLVEKSVGLFEKSLNKRDFLKIINLLCSLSHGGQFEKNINILFSNNWSGLQLIDQKRSCKLVFAWFFA